MGIETKGMSRRSFLGAGAVVAAGAAFAGLAGCSPSGETKSAEATNAAAAGETRDLGSASFAISRCKTLSIIFLSSEFVSIFTIIFF